MKAFEFQAEPKDGKTLIVPSNIAEQIPLHDSIRVIVLVDEEEDVEREWMRFTNEQFLNGYAESDAIYDERSSEET